MKRGKFFCENCGTEVRPNAKVCPHCGRFFRAVRCPICSFTGESILFLRGCPNCGYAGGQRADTPGSSGFEVYTPEEVEGLGPEKRRRRTPAGYTRKGAPPPPWLYWIVFATLLVAFGILVVIYLNL